MRKLLLATTLLWPAIAGAADLKAPPLAPVAFADANCTYAGCVAPYFGGGISESGGSFNIVSTGVGGLTNNNMNLFLDTGYDYWDGRFFLGVNALAEYGVISNGAIPGGGNSALWGAGAWAKVGYNVANAFGITPGSGSVNPITTLFATTVPYVDIGTFCRPWGCGFLSGAGAMGWLSKNVTLHADYLHVNYNNAMINPNVSQQTEDMVLAGIDYHFGL